MRPIIIVILLSVITTETYSNNNVVINGKFASQPFKEIPLTKLGLNNINSVSELTATVDKAGHFQFSFFTNEAGFYRLGDGWFGHIVFIEPGDSISITLTPYQQQSTSNQAPLRTFNKMTVQSGKAKQYLFFDELYQKAKLPFKYQAGKETAAHYKKKCETAYTISINLLNKYIRSKQISDSFAYYTKAEINAQYILNLCDCLYWIPKQSLPVNFFENVKMDDFSDENIANKTNSYITAVSVYNVYVANNFDTHLQRLSNLDGEFKWAFNNLTGIVRDRILSWVIDDYKDKNITSYDSIYNVFLLNCQTIYYKNWVVRNQALYQQQKKAQVASFNDILLKTKVIDDFGDTLSFASILDKESNSIIDFWATWCKPCLAERPGFEKAANKYKNKLTFISISTDQNFDVWHKFSNKSKSVKEYLLVGNFKSPLALYLKLESIPRFIAVNKSETKVVDDNLTRPQFEQQFSETLSSLID